MKPLKSPFSKRLKYLFEYSLYRLFSGLARALPRRSALQLGNRLGDLARLLLPGRRRIVRNNLRRAFPEMNSPEMAQHLRAIFRHLGMGTMEMLRVPLLRQNDLLALFEIEGLEHLREAYALNQGVFLLTGHLGFWEAGTFLLPALGFPTDFVVKPMKNPRVDRHLRKLREAAGGRCLDSRHGARKIVRSLAQKRGVGILLDQHVSPRQAVAVDFFGQKAYTTPVIAEIAMRYDVPVVPIFSYRRPDNRYQVIIEPMLRLPHDPEGATAHTALLTACIEKAVRKDIDQWFWLHRRWR